MCGHYRLSQDTDNQTKVFVVVSKRKEEVSERSYSIGQGFIDVGRYLHILFSCYLFTPFSPQFHGIQLVVSLVPSLQLPYGLGRGEG
jgi:hypothetical protein